MTKTADPPSSESGECYFLDIESHFVESRGTPFLFSSKDWALMKGWHEEGIPLSIVLEAIDQCFENQKKRGGKRIISSLSYCRHAVKEIWSERRDLQIGGQEQGPELDPATRLASLADQMMEDRQREPLVGHELERASLQVRSAHEGRSVPQIEELLMALELELFKTLEALLPAGEVEAIHAAIEQQLERFAIRDEETLRKTREANFRRLLREKLALPRLSLFG